MSASDTGDDAPLTQVFSSVRNIDSASPPASRTASVSTAALRGETASSTPTASASAKRQSLDAQCRRIDAVTELEIIGWHQRLEDAKQVSRDRHLAHRIGDRAVLDPEAGSTAAVVAGYPVDARADQVGDIETLLDVGHQLGRRH